MLGNDDYCRRRTGEPAGSLVLPTGPWTYAKCNMT